MEAIKTDWRQYRKSTHLASADLDAMETAGSKLIFTIKKLIVIHFLNLDYFITSKNVLS